jgi:hypothetical protein
MQWEWRGFSPSRRSIQKTFWNRRSRLMFKGARWPKRKFGNQKTERDGHWFDSKLEGALYQELKLLEKAGEIEGLHHHPGTVFLSEARIQFRPDFTFIRKATGLREWAEAKGYQDAKWPLKKKLWLHYGPGHLHIYGGSHARLRLIETIIPRGEHGLQEGGSGDSSGVRKVGGFNECRKDKA